MFPEQTDREFYEKYPTIYHLRNHLMNDDRKFDLREIFLAIHHIVKYRGNFLNNTPVSRFSTDKINFNDDFSIINNAYAELDPVNLFEINEEKISEISELFMNKELSNLDKQKQVAKLLVVTTGDKSADKLNSDIAKQFSKAILGYKFDLAQVLKVNTDDKNKWKIQLSDEN